MKNYDPKAKYHEADYWVRKEGDFYTLGVTDFGQEFFRNLHSVAFPKIGSTIEKGTPFCSVESDKVSTDLIAPVSGKVVELNTDLDKNANWVNQFPYTKGWILKLQNVSSDEFEALTSAEEYVETIKVFFNK